MFSHGVTVWTEFLISVGLINKEHGYRRQLTEQDVPSFVPNTAKEIVRLRTMFPEGTPFAVLLIPARFEVRDDDAFFRQLRVSVTEELAAQNITVIDPIVGFREKGFGPTHFAHDGHWSPLGHRVAGETAAQWLQTVRK